jgi:hypothetical protein
MLFFVISVSWSLKFARRVNSFYRLILGEPSSKPVVKKGDLVSLLLVTTILEQDIHYNLPLGHRIEQKSISQYLEFGEFNTACSKDNLQ